MISDVFMFACATFLLLQATGIALDVKEVTFSSIKIRVTHLTALAQFQFFKNCNDSKDYVLKILRSVLKREHIAMLQKALTGKIQFKVVFKFPEIDSGNCFILSLIPVICIMMTSLCHR